MNETEAIVCLRCGLTAEPGRHFCASCAAPLTAHAVCDPFDVIKTEGFIYREASQHPDKLIVVMGMVLLLGPTFLVALCGATIPPILILIEGLDENWTNKLDALVYLLVLCGGWAAISGKLLYRTITNYFFPDGLDRPETEELSTGQTPPSDVPAAPPEAPPPVDLGEKLRDYLRKQDEKYRNEERGG